MFFDESDQIVSHSTAPDGILWRYSFEIALILVAQQARNLPKPEFIIEKDLVCPPGFRIVIDAIVKVNSSPPRFTNPCSAAAQRRAGYGNEWTSRT
jgi:hypothetical protein